MHVSSRGRSRRCSLRRGEPAPVPPVTHLQLQVTRMPPGFTNASASAFSFRYLFEAGRSDALRFEFKIGV